MSKLIKHIFFFHMLVFLSAFNVSNIEAAAGDLDVSFNNTGKVLTSFGQGWTRGDSVLIQSDGKIVAVGLHENPLNPDSASIALARYLTTGAMDVTFGQNGKVQAYINHGYAEPFSAVIDGNKILVVGNFLDTNDYNSAFLARFRKDGSLDPIFGSGGIVLLTLSYECMASDVALQADGKIVVGLTAQNPDSDFHVARFTKNGSLDPSFGVNGISTLDFLGIDSKTTSVVIQTDGKIVVGGYVDKGNGYFAALARFNTDGILDTSFGTTGFVVLDPSKGEESCYDLALQTDGKIILSGRSDAGIDGDFLIARFNSDGSLDTSFGSLGSLTIDFQNFNDEATAVLVKGSGRIIVTGWSSMDANSDDQSFALVRLLSNGSLDTSFGSGGKVTTDFSSGQDVGYGANQQSDGKLVVLGSSQYKTFALARYLTN